MKTRVRELVGQGDALFAERSPLLSLWQEIGDNFHPIRAEFTRTRTPGEEFAAHLMTGAPVLAHRELTDQFAAMLRPRGKKWFSATVEREEIANNTAAKAWMEAKCNTMRRIMYDRTAMFTRATKEADGDFAAFGQAAITVEVNGDRNGLLYRTWHLRDVVWCENALGQIDTVHLRWKLPARSVMKLFPKTHDPKLAELCQKNPNQLIEIRRIIIPADEYDFTNTEAARKAARFPFLSIYVDTVHDTILEETPLKRSPFIIPRWATVSGSQYAHSPATVVGLADARLLQRITLTLIEAGEKAVNPPMIAAGDMVQGGINTYAGGLTWVDADYDERTGEALRVLGAEGKGQLAFGVDMADRYENLIKRAFYLDQLNMPQTEGDMTATETRVRVEEYMRAALPLFEPMELEYNGALVEETWNLALENGAFGNLSDMPDELQGQEMKWTFESPLQAAQSRDKAVAFQEAGQLLAMAAQIDPQSAVEIDIRTAFRDALDGAQIPAKWIVADEVAQKVRGQAAQEKQMQDAAAQIGAAAQTAGMVGDAASRLQVAGLVPQAAGLAGVQAAPV
ncbi:portal protein [uncultured Methylobacterium sp.]|uniref:portal protein n=1 Tax=uncultured Methylobacterium sp. TaxID=157278 RepID=UPI0035C971CB